MNYNRLLYNVRYMAKGKARKSYLYAASSIRRVSAYVQYLVGTDIVTKGALVSDPVIVTGIYRSGTSLLSRIVRYLGVNFGPNEHMYASTGGIAHLNPEGFEENLIFNELGLYLMHIKGGHGVKFPDERLYDNYRIEDIKPFEYWYYCNYIYSQAEDRIDSKIRWELHRKYSANNLNDYVSEYFDGSIWGFKDVHAGIYFQVYKNQWPTMKLLIAFRNPVDQVNSAKRLDNKVNVRNWVDYYTRLLNNTEDMNVLWVNYDRLKAGDTEVVRSIMNYLQVEADSNAISGIDSMIKKSPYNVLRSYTNEEYDSAWRVYDELDASSLG